MPTHPTKKPKISKPNPPSTKPPPSTSFPHTQSNPKPRNPLHQPLLSTFTAALSPLLTSPSLPLKIQSLKSHLYARDFLSAFKDEEALEAYAAKWSPPRALAYSELLVELEGKVGGFLEGEGKGRGRRRGKMLCLGGGAGAEVVGFGGWKSSLGGDYGEGKERGGQLARGELGLEILAVDMAPWSSCLGKLVSALTTPPPVSAYASRAVKDANRALVNAEDFEVELLRRDVLDLGKGELGGMCEGVGMVTLMFTLNELYCTSVAKTTGLLLGLTEVLGKGVVLLVVDSPGSYSTVGVNGTGADEEGKGNGNRKGGKKYPMQWLLDHTLLEAVNGDGEGNGKWEKVHGEESRWFRLGEDLRYPISLEDLRMQVHVYRRL